MSDKVVGLRIDVDTFRGTGRGVPELCRILKKFNVSGTFYFSVGPDNMGRHLWRLLKPAFLWKMLRTNAAGLYGPEIVLMGTAWPGPQIGKHFKQVILDTANAGHEIGFHAWDHHKLQAGLLTMSDKALKSEFERGTAFLSGILGHFPASSAAPGWRCDERLLKMKSAMPFVYNSDCRGTHPFYPVLADGTVEKLQIPVTLPTYDEALGRDGVTDGNYNDHMISLLKEDAPNVLTIHAEAEGGRCAAMFEDFMARITGAGYRVIPLGKMAEEWKDKAPKGCIRLLPFPGREGTLAVQCELDETK